MTDDMKEALLTYRRPNGSVNVSSGVGDDLWHLLGKYYLNSSSYTTYDRREWKQTMNKLVKKLEIAFRRNVDTDAIHRKKVDRHLRMFQSAVDKGPEAEPQAIVQLACLAFELMGGMPDNRKVEHATHESDFDLKRFRTVRYLQTPGQKARLILDTAGWDMFKDDYSRDEIEGEYYGRPEKFLAWYKENFPKAYVKLF